jgi:hypothetical protein
MDTGAVTLDDSAVEHSPSAPGVYFLYRADELTYVGLAEQGEGIRESLENHVSSTCAGCEQRATRFTYEITHHPRRRHRQHLNAYRERHGGRVPECNECRPCGS